MKKLLSVLLSIAMIVGCISMSFTAFAEGEYDDFVAKFNEATKKAASEFENEDGTMNYASGYTFEQVIDAAMANVTGDEQKNLLKTVLMDKYPEFPDYDDKDQNPNDCYTEMEVDEGIFAKFVNYTAVARILSGVEEIERTQVKKFSNGADTIGEYALKEAKLTSDMIENVIDEGAGAYTVEFKDVDIAADESVENSAIAAVLSSYPELDGMDDRIKDDAKTRGTGIKFQDFQLKVTSISMRVVFNDDDTLSEFVFSYRIEGTAVAKLSGEVLNGDGSVDVKVSYKEFDNYDPDSGEFNISELVKRINEGTAYAVDSKAGYDYSRVADYPMGVSDYAHFSINLSKEAIEENMDPNSMVAGILQGLDIYSFIDSPANIGITNVLIVLDDVAGIRLEGLKWVCNCADCPECDCDECTAEHPCTCTGCHCHYDLVSSEELLGTGMKKLSEKLQDVVRNGVKDAFDFGTEAATVPAGKNAQNYIGDRALKKTELTVNDIDTSMMPPTVQQDGSIMFMLPTQVNPDENSALGHLTDDYASKEEIMSAMKMGFLNTFGVDPFTPSDDGANTGVTYQNIMVTVKFEEADDTNPYGNGKIESLNTYYYCMTNLSVAGGIITGDFGSHVSADYDEFNYLEYEKGDADVSGRVSIIDVKLVLKHIVKTETIEGLGFELADMNEDGKLTVLDAKKILQKIADDAAAGI